MTQPSIHIIHDFFEDLHLFVSLVKLPRMPGDDLGRWFERKVAHYFGSYRNCDVIGVTSRMNIVPFSGMPHEFDLLIESGGHLFLFECKCSASERKKVSHNDLLLFEEKSFDYWLRHIEMDDIRKVFRIFVTKVPPDDEARNFGYLWNIIFVEPELMPIPQIISFLSRTDVCQAVNIHHPEIQRSILDKVCRSVDRLFVRHADDRQQFILNLGDLVYQNSPRLSTDQVRLTQRTLSNIFHQYLYQHEPLYLQQKITELEGKFGARLS